MEQCNYIRWFYMETSQNSCLGFGSIDAKLFFIPNYSVTPLLWKVNWAYRNELPELGDSVKWED